MSKERLLIDTDCGVDDAQAILMAFAHPQTQVEAISAVAGNVEVDKVTANVGVILDLLDADAPLYRGADRPLVQPPEPAHFIHGADGLGNANFDPPRTQPVAGEHAAQAIARLARQAPGEITLVTLGPLTNVALAVRLDPQLAQNIKRVVCMGGAVQAQGNTAMVSEFNFWSDPEATHIVLETFPDVTIASWELTLQHGLPWEQYDALVETTTPKGQFVRRITAEILGAVKAHPLYGSLGMLLPDPLAMACALEPGIILEQERRRVVMELHGAHTRGQTVVDWMGETDQPANVNIVRRVDMDAFGRLMQAAVQ